MMVRPEPDSTGKIDLSHCVIGSGPSGVACAHALLQRGAKVTLLDAGVSLEKSRADLVAQMRALPPSSWSAGQIQKLKEGMESSAKGIPLKLAFGSDYPYREYDRHFPADYENVALRPTLARGGFSSVWGAAMLPYSEQDVAGWPVRISDLAEHYGAVAKFTGLSARRDDLEKLFPIYLDQPAALNLSSQAKIFLGKLEKNRTPLQKAGIVFGQARVGVRVAQSPQSPGCVYCGLCMYGCPYGYIYNSEDTIRELQKNPNFTYQPDVVVTRLRESSTRVVIDGVHRVSREPFAAEAGRVYLAAGVIPTTQILLRSQSLYDHTVRLKDSQYFLIPLALTRSAGDVRHELLHTLSQLFVEIFDSQISPHSIHLQVYSYNDLIGSAVRKTFDPLAGPLEFLARSLERRLLIVQGYLHSNHSSRIALTLKKGEPDRMQLKAEPNSETKPMIHRVIRKLLRHAMHFGAVPVSPMLQIADAGRGFHSGSSFPMSANPAAMQSDTLGRPHGWSRVHIADASALPDIPATQITFSVMANAHRIGWLCAGMP
jgi:choline dehydrogenase-like flavoprotein